MPRRTVLLAISVATLVLSTTGCSSGEREAAAPSAVGTVLASDMPLSPSAPGMSASAEASVGGLRRATRLCVINSSTRAATLNVTKRDSQDGGPGLAPGQRVCAEGWSAVTVDVQALLAVDGDSGAFEVFADNATIGQPTLSVDRDRGCIAYNAWSVGASQVFDDGIVRLTGQRLADTDWKEFTLTIADSASPSSDGLPRPCTLTPRGGHG